MSYLIPYYFVFDCSTYNGRGIDPSQTEVDELRKPRYMEVIIYQQTLLSLKTTKKNIELIDKLDGTGSVSRKTKGK